MAKELYKKILESKEYVEKRGYIIFPLCFIFFIFTVWFTFKIFYVTPYGFYFLPVGQGDSSLIITEKGRKILIDGGPPSGNLPFWLDNILPFYDKYIDVVILTHPQLDHFGGFLKLLNSYKVGVFVENGTQNNTVSYLNLKKVIQNKNIKTIVLKRGDEIISGNDILKIVYPFDFEKNYKDLNEKAIVVEAFVKETKALFTSDIDKEIESKIINLVSNVDVLKVPHHGSFHSLNNSFFEKLSPYVSIIEVGKNSYGHPSDKVVEYLKGLGSLVLRTDSESAILRVFKDKDKIMISKMVSK
jgi:competence protein ComEC